MVLLYSCVAVVLLLVNYGLLVLAKMLVGVDNPFVFNGGGSISGGNNKLELKSINIKGTSRLFVTLNEFALTKPIKINFFGEISYEEFKKN